MKRACPDQDRHLLPLVEDAGGAFEVFLCGQDLGRFISDPGEDGAVHSRRRLDGIHQLQVIRHDDAGDAALGLGDAHRPVDQLTNLRRLRRHMDVLAGDVLEQRDQIDLLLILAAERDARLLPDDRQYRLMVHLRVV